MSTLSICTAVQDEEEPIKWYLECCVHLSKALGDDLREVIIIHGGSKDNTVEVIKSYQDRVPIKLLERPFDCTRDQQNFGLEKCTGDFIFGPDADMTWTTNFSDVFKSGVFERGNYWDFPMLFTGRDAYHYFYKWPLGVNMRLWKRGPLWGQHRKFHVQLEGQTPGIPVCREVIIFENSCRIKDDKALLWRGQRKQIHADEMAAEGQGPGPPENFWGAAHSPDSEVTLLEPHIHSLVLPSTNG